MSTKILYVDELSNNDRLGITLKLDRIRYNANVLKDEYLDKFMTSIGEINEANFLTTAGRYICVLTISLDDSKYQMQFMDLAKEKEMIEFALNRLRIDSDLTIEAFKKAVQFLEENYEKVYYDVELLDGELPLEAK